MTRVTGIGSVSWPEPPESASNPPVQQPMGGPLVEPGSKPLAKSGGMTAVRALSRLTLVDLAKGAELKIAENRDLIPREAEKLLAEAEKRLDEAGVAYTRTTTSDGFDAIRITPARTGHFLVEPASDLEALDGFRFLYSPAKLLTQGSRGDNWRYRREVCMSHAAIEEQRLDPITIHEIEHTVLSRCEEKGIPQLFTGNVASFGGSMVDADDDIGGYADHLSFQEISAYSIQCEMLAVRLQQTDPPPNLAAEVKELKDMAAWGWALSGRVAKIAAKTVAQLESAPEEALFERQALTVAPKDAPEREGGPPVVWVTVRRIDRFQPQVPIPHAYWDGGPEGMVTVAKDHFATLRDVSASLAPMFRAIMDEAGAVAAKSPIEPGDVTKLVALTKAMRTATTDAAFGYRARCESVMPPSTAP